MDAYLRRRANDPRYRLATAEPTSWWDAYAGIEEKPSIVATAEGAGGAVAAKEHPLHVVRHNAMKCWEGYERVPGTKAGADGSCRKKGDDKKKKKKSSKSRSRSRSRSRSSSSESDGEGGRRKKAKKSDKE